MQLILTRSDWIWMIFQLTALSGLAYSYTWRVAVPAGPPFMNPNPDNDQKSGIATDLFKTVADASSTDNFSLVPISNWLEQSELMNPENMTRLELGALACIRDQLNTSAGIDLCLFEQTTTTFDALRETMSSAITSVPWMHLRPVLLATCSGNECPRRIQPSILNAMYFMRSFHSSVWSLLLLYILTAAGLLFLFEITHTFRLGKKPVQSAPDGDQFTLVESFMCVALAMFLQPYYKFPKAWAGMVLTLFWYAFCLICIITYALGVSRLLFQTDEQASSHNTLSISVEKEIACEHHNVWCRLLNEKMNVKVTGVELSWNGSELTLSSLEHQTPLLVDQLTATLIMYQTVKVNDSGTEKYVHWFPAEFDCAGMTEPPNLPSIPLTFSATQPEAIRSVNYYVQSLQESGVLGQLATKWNSGSVQSTNLCRPTDAADNTSPIRMYQMNGPFLFMIVGALSSLVAHFCEFFYYSVIKKDSARSRNISETDPAAALLT